VADETPPTSEALAAAFTGRMREHLEHLKGKTWWTEPPTVVLNRLGRRLRRLRRQVRTGGHVGDVIDAAVAIATDTVVVSACLLSDRGHQLEELLRAPPKLPPELLAIGVDPARLASPEAVDIATTCDGLRDILLSKNAAYGNSALDPIRIFSKAGPEEQLRVRADDKLSRLVRGTADGDEDTELDLIGYLILMRVFRRRRDRLAASATKEG
jgi:hypothetical protein